MSGIFLWRRNGHEGNGQKGENQRQIPVAGAFLVEERRGNDACEKDGGGAGEGEEQGGGQMEDGFLQRELQDGAECEHEASDPAFRAEMPRFTDYDVRRAECENRGVEEAEKDIAVVLHEAFRGAWHVVVPAEFHGDRAAAEQRQHDQ